MYKRCKTLIEQKSFCHCITMFFVPFIPVHYRMSCIKIHRHVLLERSLLSADATECYKLSIWDPSGQHSKINKPKSGLVRPEYTELGSSMARYSREIRGRRSHRQMRETWQTDGHDRKRDGQRDILLRRRRPQSRGSDEEVPARPSFEVRSQAVKLI